MPLDFIGFPGIFLQFMYEVRGWIVDQSNVQSCHISKHGHPVQKLTLTPIAFWTVIHIDDQLFDFTAKRFKNTARNQLFPWSHIM